LFWWERGRGLIEADTLARRHRHACDRWRSSSVGFRSATATKVGLKKAPQLRGFQDLKFAMTRWIAVSSGPDAGKILRGNIRPCRATASRVFTSINSLRLERWGHTPAEPQGLRVTSRSLIVPDSQQMLWPPLPVPASMLRVSVLFLHHLLCPLSASRETRTTLEWFEANPMPPQRIRAETATCRSCRSSGRTKVYRVPTTFACGKSPTAGKLAGKPH
jgi:hypothetical protein